MKSFKIPEATIMRLSVYSRYLKRLMKQGITTISSSDIADSTGATSAQVRKDLAYFGEFGTRGVGYDVPTLYESIAGILGLNKQWDVVIVGAGKLGLALSMYEGFRERGFRNRAIFDVDPIKVGKKVQGVKILHSDTIYDVCRELKPDIGIIAVPGEEAQKIADLMIAAGVRSILNFAPRVVTVPYDVQVRNVDLSVHLEILTYNMAMQDKE